MIKVFRQHGLVHILHDGWTSIGQTTEKALVSALQKAVAQPGSVVPAASKMPPEDYILHAAEVIDSLLPPGERSGQISEGVQTG